MGLFRIREEIVKSQGTNAVKWRVLLCDNKGEPMDGYYTSFIADKIATETLPALSQITIHDLYESERYYDCEAIRVEESNEGTTVIF